MEKVELAVVQWTDRDVLLLRATTFWLNQVILLRCSEYVSKQSPNPFRKEKKIPTKQKPPQDFFINKTNKS